MGFLAAMFGPSQPVGAPDHWIIRSGAPKTFAGPSVTEHTAMQLTSVYSAVGVIADAVAQLPLDVFQRKGDKRHPKPDHPVARLLRSPNQYMGAFTLRNTAQAHALLWGNGYINVERKDAEGTPVGLWPLLPDRTALEVTGPAGQREYKYRTNVDGKSIPVEVADVVHIPALGFDGLRGYSPIYMARQAVGLAMALEKYGAKFFSNDAKSGGFLEHPGKLSADAHRRLQEAMQDQGGLDNAHRIKILEEGMKFTATTIPPDDAQFLSTRTFQVEEIARLYRIPLHMLQSQSKSTSWGTGIGQMSLGFLIYTLAPWLVRWEEELGRKLLTQQERDDGYYIKHNVNALLRGDPATRSLYFERALKKENGWMDPNEVRALEDLNPREEGRDHAGQGQVTPPRPDGGPDFPGRPPR